MDPKAVEILDFDIDPAILISYELEKLNLDNIPSDILDLPELQKTEYEEEKSCIPKQNVLNHAFSVKTEVDIDPNILFEYHQQKVIKTEPGNEPSSNTSLPEDNKENIVEKEEESDDSIDNVIKSEVLSELSEDEDDNYIEGLRARGPEKFRRHLSKRKGQYKKTKELTKASDLDPERLLHQSGCELIQVINEKCNDSRVSLTTSDEFFFQDDNLSISLSSPESGYATSPSSSYFIFKESHSPSFLSTTPQLSEYDEQIIESLIDIEDEDQNGGHFSGLSFSLDIDTIINYLKEPTLTIDELNQAPAIDELNQSPATDELNQSPATDELNKSPATDELNQSPATDELNASFVKNKVEVLKHSLDKQTLLSIKPSVLTNKIFSTMENSKNSLKCKPLSNKAKKRLYDTLCQDKYFTEQAKIFKRIQADEGNKKDSKVIYIPEDQEANKEHQTNLHLAVLNSNIEEIYNIVEIHKQYNKPFSDINVRDKSGKVRNPDRFGLCSAKRSFFSGGVFKRKYSSTKPGHLTNDPPVPCDYATSDKKWVLNEERMLLGLFKFRKIRKL